MQTRCHTVLRRLCSQELPAQHSQTYLPQLWLEKLDVINGVCKTAGSYIITLSCEAQNDRDDLRDFMDEIVSYPNSGQGLDNMLAQANEAAALIRQALKEEHALKLDFLSTVLKHVSCCQGFTNKLRSSASLGLPSLLCCAQNGAC